MTKPGASKKKSAVARDKAEDEILQNIREIDFAIREYPVETIVQKYQKGLETEENELFIPDYQRELAWPAEHQSRFIESVLIGLPIPYLFGADIGDDEGRIEIVDGSQRIRTLSMFLNNEVELIGLEKLASLNGFRFSDLLQGRQRRFCRQTIRMIELTEKADEGVRRDIFERINTGSVDLAPMEKRRGIRPGAVLDLVETCAADPVFLELTPFTSTQLARKTDQELVLRFFAYLDRYLSFKNRVDTFLNKFMDDKNKQWSSADDEEPANLKAEFLEMLSFVKAHFPNGFAKESRHKTTPRIRFDAIAVGTTLALRERPNLKPVDVSGWLGSKDFKRRTTAGSSNSLPRVKGRIEFVRDALLKGASN